MSGKQNKGSSHDQTPCNHDTERNLISLTDTVIFSGTVILCGKGIQGSSKSISCIPGNRFNLLPDPLGSDSSWSEGRNHTCQEHGKINSNNSESGRYTNPANGMVDFFMADGKEMDFLQYIFVIFSPKIPAIITSITTNWAETVAMAAPITSSCGKSLCRGSGEDPGSYS